MNHPRENLEAGEQAIRDKLDDMFRLVTDAVEKSIHCLTDHDTAAAGKIVDEDTLINTIQHKIDELSILTIALQQPVASDLRQLMASIHISIELERIADHAAAIAAIVLSIDDRPDEAHVKALHDIGERCRTMLRLAEQAYIETDDQLARDIAVLDDEIDMAESELNQLMFQAMQDKPAQAEMFTRLTWVTHNFERMGDRITNIAERIVYMKTSETPDLNN